MSEFLDTSTVRRYLASAASVAALFVAAGCGQEIKATNSFAGSCTPENTRPLPLSTDMFKAHDTRKGNIYSCNYLQDMRIPFDQPTKLLKAVESNVQSSDFKLSAHLGGFVLLGTGVLSSDVNVSSKLQEKRVTAIRFEDSDKAIRTILVDTDKTRIKPCAEEDCEPSVTFNVSERPLWVKETNDKANGPDDSSIWVYEQYVDYNDGDNRQRILSMLAIKGPNDAKNDYEKGITGGPDSVSNVVSALSTSIVLELPQSAIG